MRQIEDIEDDCLARRRIAHNGPSARLESLGTQPRAAEILYDLYGLSPDERNLVENDTGRRNAALPGA